MLDPLAMASLGEPVGLPGAPDGHEMERLEVLRRLAVEADALRQLHVAEDELDRVALVAALRRAAQTVLHDRPLGARLLERHLLFGFAQLALDAPGATDGLRELVEAGPGLLARSRVDPGRGSLAAGHLELEAARRLPGLLEACAGAAAELAVPGERFAVEAALGPLLAAAAEGAGWLLKEYIPAAPSPEPALPDLDWVGVGFSLDELESEAEDALAAAVGELVEARDGALATAPGPPASAAEVRRAWDATALLTAARLDLPAPGGVEVREAPGWLRPLLAPLAPIVPGPGAAGPVLLVGAAPSAGLEGAVADLYLRDYLPAACARANFSAARNLLPAPELAEGWRACHATTAAGAGELAWRAALALAAIAMVGGRATVEQAAELIAAESGLPLEQARLQAFAVAERPLSALTVLAGRRALRAGTPALGEKGIAHWLRLGPIPGAVLRTLDS